MTDVVLLDETPLSQITHPKIKPEIKDWLLALLKTETVLRVPEIVDYELRRELIRLEKTKSLKRLDEFINDVGFIPITSETMKLAAQLWAWVRKKGKPTAPNLSLDADVILVSQAILQLNHFEKSIVVTSNFKHISRFSEQGIEVWDWQTTLKAFS